MQRSLLRTKCNISVQEQCVHLYYDERRAGQWNDAACEGENGFICMTYKSKELLFMCIFIFCLQSMVLLSNTIPKSVFKNCFISQQNRLVLKDATRYPTPGLSTGSSWVAKSNLGYLAQIDYSERQKSCTRMWMFNAKKTYKDKVRPRFYLLGS